MHWNLNSRRRNGAQPLSSMLLAMETTHRIKARLLQESESLFHSIQEGEKEPNHTNSKLKSKRARFPLQKKACTITSISTRKGSYRSMIFSSRKSSSSQQKPIFSLLATVLI